MATAIETALANEARRGELKQKVAKLKGAVDATASIVQRLSVLNSDALIQVESASAELAALEAGAGPGITADYGAKSIVSQLLETERFAAKVAVIDFIKSNPSAAEEEANTVWHAAAIASHPDFTYVLQDGLIMSKLYRVNLLAGGHIHELTWEAHRQFILNTSKEILVTM